MLFSFYFVQYYWYLLVHFLISWIQLQLYQLIQHECAHELLCSPVVSARLSWPNLSWPCLMVTGVLSHTLLPYQSNSGSFKTRSFKADMHRGHILMRTWVSWSLSGVSRSLWHNSSLFCTCLHHFTSFPFISTAYICRLAEQQGCFPVGLCSNTDKYSKSKLAVILTKWMWK